MENKKREYKRFTKEEDNLIVQLYEKDTSDNTDIAKWKKVQQEMYRKGFRRTFKGLSTRYYKLTKEKGEEEIKEENPLIELFRLPKHQQHKIIGIINSFDDLPNQSLNVIREYIDYKQRVEHD